MTDVRAFRALRYNPAVVGDWGAVLGPPYDVIDEAQRARLLARSPYQITHVESPDGLDAIDAAGDRLRQWRRDGALTQDATPAYYLAQHRFNHAGREHTRLSLYAAVRLTPWDDGDVLPHEWTMSGPKEARMRLRGAARADISPIMSVVPDRDGVIGKLLDAALDAEPALQGTDAGGEHHSLRPIDNPDTVAALRAAFAADTLYIADGHHRYESALQYRDLRAGEAGDAWSGDEGENFILMGIVRAADPGLIVGATHRLVHVSPPPDALDRIRASFDVEDAGPAAGDLDALLGKLAAAGTDTVAMAVVGLQPGRAHLLRARQPVSLPNDVPRSWAALGAALLQYLVLDPVLAIDDEALRAGQAVRYSHDAAAVVSAVADSSAALAFILNPPTLEQTFASADAGDRMPQKSTYFTPKLPTGVVLHAFD